MRLFSFLKSAGSKLLGKKVEAPVPPKDATADALEL